MTKQKFSVNISKALYHYYTYEIEAENEEEATRKVSELISSGQLTDDDLVFSQAEDDYGIEYNRDAYTVVDAIKI